jgi:hypothetical protein
MSNQELEKNIMEKIDTGQIKLKSKYVFLAEKLGLGTAFAFSVVLSVLLFNLTLFYMKETDNLQYLSFGKNGIFAFLESFPYALVISFTVFMVLASYLTTKSDVSYKRPFGYIAISLIFFVMFLGGALTYTKAAEQIENANYPFGAFLMKSSLEMRDKGVAGIVFETDEEYLIVETPQGLRNIDLTKAEDDVPQVEKGKFVVAVGNSDEYDFIAQDIMVLEKEEMPVIDRGIERKFKKFIKEKLDDENIHSLPSELMYFKEKDKTCIKDCFELKIHPKKCFDDCFKAAR